MKKRLLSVFLCLCMVFGLVPATVWAETTNGHTHYLCGGSTCNGSGHKNETYKTTFEKEIKQEGNTLKIGGEPWAPTKGSNDTFYILPAGTYYLGSDISSEYTIKIENNVTLCLNGHKITAANEKDAIKLTGGSFTLTDCQKTGNITHARNTNGRGVYVMYSDSFTVSGEVTVTDNTKGGTKGADGKFTGDTKNNVYLPTGKTITIGTDKLSEGAQLGMTLDEYYGDKAFTSGWNTKMSGKSPADYFISDVGGKGFELSGGEVKLCDGHTHYLCGDSTCNSSGHATESSKTTFAKEIKQVSGTLYIDNIEWTVSSYGNYTLFSSKASICFFNFITLASAFGHFMIISKNSFIFSIIRIFIMYLL